MASVHILIIFAVIGGQAGYAGNFVTLQVAPEVNGQCGQTSVLKCIINISKDVEKPEITLIKWTKEDNEEPLLNYLSGDLKTMPGYSLAQKSWKSDFDVSLSINNITLQHEGEYTCEVVVNNAHKMEKSRLKVTPCRYGALVITHSKMVNNDSVLECRTSSGLLEGQIRWFDKEGKEKKGASTNTMKTDRGLFQLYSRLILQDGLAASKYTCAVFNASGGQEEEAIWESPKSLKKSQILNNDSKHQHYKIVTPLVVIGSCIVGLLLALLVCRWKRRQRSPKYHEHYRPSTSGLTASTDDTDVEDQETADVHRSATQGSTSVVIPAEQLE